MILPLADTTFVEATWILILKSIVIFAVIFAIVPMLTVMERKLLGRFQARYGPNRVGPLGLLQPLADAVKLITKEHYRPRAAIPLLYYIAPSIVVFTGVATLAIIPFGNVQDGFGSTGSTFPSASSTSSPSARSRSTACCSAAGPPAPSTASSGRCARRRS